MSDKAQLLIDIRCVALRWLRKYLFGIEILALAEKYKKAQYKYKTETNLVSLGIVQLAIPLELEACQELLHLQANVPGRYFQLFEFLNILNFWNFEYFELLE